jgi:hypothetical protein
MKPNTQQRLTFVLAELEDIVQMSDKALGVARVGSAVSESAHRGYMRLVSQHNRLDMARRAVWEVIHER